jgi:hypothetical protein
MENFQDIFNLNADDFVEKSNTRESEFYKPSAKDGKDNVYKSLIRFVPWHKDPKKSKVKKYSYWLEDPLTGDGFSVDCPSTVNQKSVLQDTFWRLKKSPSVAEQKLSDKFKRRENYYALVQILKDEHRPDLVGKIKVFKFGQKLNAILQSELQPEYGKPFNPFDPLKGRPMALQVTISGGYNNYDLSKFVGDEFPCILEGKKIEATRESMQAFFEYLKTSSPDLSNYDYKDWDEELRAKVKAVIENTVPSMRTAETLAKESAASSRTSNADIDLDSFDKPSKSPKSNADDLDFEYKSKSAKSKEDDLDFDLDSLNGGTDDDDLYSGL